ncbi:RcpC/CpaB family pilus assembly protein [Streptomyces aureoverticillatus]|uniref:RcpC/CpaB family pilus assembly protein n=1 Tax=Streptomyces aureoverticillatus TaxID=66871 RepID=UPI001EF8E649|nr:RcpC/CpaB family pilus assembly protein [Streptomyces aureoverticillatus]
MGAPGGGTGGGGSSAPPPCQVPHFSPLHVRGGRRRLRRLMRHRRRAMAAGLAMTAAALAATGPPAPGQARPRDSAASMAAEERGGDGVGQRPRRAARLVTAPVRIADAATVRLLRPGDRVDVVAADGSGVGGPGAGSAGSAGSAGAGGAVARVVAAGARVSAVPESPDSAAEGGALVVLSVPRATAARLAGASATARLAVTLR